MQQENLSNNIIREDPIHLRTHKRDKSVLTNTLMRKCIAYALVCISIYADGGRIKVFVEFVLQ